MQATTNLRPLLCRCNLSGLRCATSFALCCSFERTVSDGFGQNGDLHRLGFREIMVIGLPIQPLLLESRQIRAHFVLQLH